MAEPVQGEDELAARRRLRDAVAKMDADAAEAKRKKPLLTPRFVAQVTKILILIVALFAIVAFREQCGQGVVNLFDQVAPPP
jgi:hypothetical protein